MGNTRKRKLETNVICQIGVIVRDIEQAARNYAELFGMEMPAIVTTGPEEETHIRFRGHPTPGRAKLAFFKMGNISLELIEPIDGPSTWREHLDTFGPSIHHIGLEVRDMDKAIDVLTEHGIVPLQQGEFKGGRYLYADAMTQLGIILELLQHTE